MADQDLGATGRDVSVEIAIDRNSIEITDAVTSFEAEPVFDNVTRKHLGTVNRDIDYIPVGWSGTIVITAKTRAVEDALNQYINARVNRIPINVAISEQTINKNGDVTLHTYIQVQFSVSKRAQREDAVEYTMTWESGRPRVVVQ